jgi:hypothetical protein
MIVGGQERREDEGGEEAGTIVEVVGSGGVQGVHIEGVGIQTKAQDLPSGRKWARLARSAEAAATQQQQAHPQADDAAQPERVGSSVTHRLSPDQDRSGALDQNLDGVPPILLVGRSWAAHLNTSAAYTNAQTLHIVTFRSSCEPVTDRRRLGRWFTLALPRKPAALLGV